MVPNRWNLPHIMVERIVMTGIRVVKISKLYARQGAIFSSKDSIIMTIIRRWW